MKNDEHLRAQFPADNLGLHAYYLEEAARSGNGEWLTAANDLLRTGAVLYSRGVYRLPG